MRALLPLVLSLLTPTALGQAFVDGAGQLPTSPGSNNSWTENVDWADVDLDGDFDALFADGGGVGNDQNRLWINQGGAQGGAMGFFLDRTSAQYPVLLDQSRDVDLADIDGDSDPDVLVSNTSGFTNQANQIVVNQGGLQGGTAGFFANETSTRWVDLGINNGTTSLSSIWPSLVLASGGFIDNSGDTVLGDLDADGDMDILHASYGAGAFVANIPHRVFLNDGLGFFEEFNPSGFQVGSAGFSNGDPALWASGAQQHDTTSTNGEQADIATSSVASDLGDLDGDFDLDLLLGALNEQPRLFRNGLAGGVLPPFVDITAGAFSQLVSDNGTFEQEFGDIDDDQDLDLYGVNWGASFQDALMLNDGAFGFGPLVSIPSSSADDEEADFLDFDADGDLDVYVANFSESGLDRLYANQGAPGFALTLTSGQLPATSDESLGVDSVDLELDGDQDVLVANAAGEPNVLLVNATATADTHAPRIVVEPLSSPACGLAAVAVRANVFDNASWEWTRYNATGLGVSVDGGPFTTYPMVFSGGQTWRGEIPAGTVGTVAYRVRSIDRAGNIGLSPTQTYTAASLESYCTAGTSAAGCQATLSASGTPSASSASGFVVTASGVEGSKDGLFFFGTNGRQANSWGNGTSFQCVLPPVKRAPLMTGTGTPGLCDGVLALDLNALWCPTCPKPAKNPGLGATVDLQLWYRDPASTSNQSTSLSDALEFPMCP